MQSKEFSIKILLTIYVTLLILLGLTILASMYPLGAWSAPVSLLIALTKAFLIGFFFMKLGLQSNALRLISLVGFFWLSLLGILIFADVLTRFSFGVLGK